MSARPAASSAPRPRRSKELELHVTTLNPGFASHPPHKHPNEELVILREGTVEALSGGVWKRAGAGIDHLQRIELAPRAAQRGRYARHLFRRQLEVGRHPRRVGVPPMDRRTILTGAGTAGFAASSPPSCWHNRPRRETRSASRRRRLGPSRKSNIRSPSR